MPQYHPNTLFSDCWASIGNITFYHRGGICYFKNKPYSTFKETPEQLRLKELHKRAIKAWQTLSHKQQFKWREYSVKVAAHRPPYGDNNHISGYNLFLSAYHGFAQLGNEHTPTPKKFVPFPIFSLNYLSCQKPKSANDITLQFRLSLYATDDYARYRVLAKIQITQPGKGRNPGLMRNALSKDIPQASESEVTFLVSDPLPQSNTKQLHIRYLLLDTKTGYRSCHQTLSTLASPTP